MTTCSSGRGSIYLRSRVTVCYVTLTEESILSSHTQDEGITLSIINLCDSVAVITTVLRLLHKVIYYQIKNNDQQSILLMIDYVIFKSTQLFNSNNCVDEYLCSC